MKLNKIILFFVAMIAIFVVCEEVFAFYGVGYSSYPMQQDRKMISAEVTGVVSVKGGVGLQSRYVHKVNNRTILDAGLNVSGGARNAKIFFGADYEIIPDYLKQPRVSVKGIFENANQFNFRKNIFGIVPTVSKGFVVSGNEVYPYVAFPTGVSLNYNTGTYDTISNGSVGVNAPLPFKDFRHLTANFEGTVSITGSYSGLFLGLSYPMR